MTPRKPQLCRPHIDSTITRRGDHRRVLCLAVGIVIKLVEFLADRRRVITIDTSLAETISRNPNRSRDRLDR